MKNLDWSKIRLLCHLQLMEQKFFIGKALICSALLILIHMLVYVGDFRKCCESSVKWTLILSCLLPTAWTFSNFIGKYRKEKNQLMWSASAMETYMSVWGVSLVNIVLWVAVVGLVSIGAIWCIGNFFYGMPMSQFLMEFLSDFYFPSLIGLGLFVTSVVLTTISWKIKNYWHYCMPLLMLVAAITPIGIAEYFYVTSYFEVVLLITFIVYVLQILAYIVWGYFLFKEVLQSRS